MLAAVSHLVLTSADVPRITDFVKDYFGVAPHFANDQFSDFVLPGGFRIAFFLPVGVTKENFGSEGERHFASIGVTTPDIDALYARSLEPRFQVQGVRASGPPKEHPWGERSFLLRDPDGNRWEITHSPSPSGMLVPRD
jgi:catechol 2,3-dioxygenase-like lactoylglutathione lyase family enzyme